MDGLPLAIELAAARVNVLGLAELVSILERRAALLRDSPASDPGRIALQGLVEWSYDLLHGDEKTLLQQLAVPPWRRVARLARRGRSDARPQRGDRRVSRCCAGRQVDRVGLVLGRRRPVRHARHRPRVRARASRRERWARRRSRGAHAELLRGAGRGGARRLRGPEWLRWRARLELENDNLWAALEYAREAPDPAVASRLGTLGWYFALAERVSEGRRFLELALAATARRRTGRAADRAARRPLLPRDRGARCSTPRSRRANARSRSPRGRVRRPGARAGATGPGARARVLGDGDGPTMARAALRRSRRRGRLGRRGAQPHPGDARRRAPGTSPPSPRWRRSSSVIRTRSSTTRSASRGCCSRRG